MSLEMDHFVDEDGKVAMLKDTVARETLKQKVTAPTVAEVGQIIRVASVDESGKPLTWEAVDTPGYETPAEAQLATGVLLAETAHNTSTPTGVTIGDLRKYRRFAIVWKGTTNTGLSNTLFQFSEYPYTNVIYRNGAAGCIATYKWVDIQKRLLQVDTASSGNPSTIGAIGTSLLTNSVPAFDLARVLGFSSAQLIDTSALDDSVELYLVNANTTTIDYNWEIRGLTV